VRATPDFLAADRLNGCVTLVSARHEPAARDRTARRFLLVLCLGVALVRATYVPRPLRNDEGGYLLVARQWHTGGEFLYGDYFVDRPPLLLLIFRIAALTDWDQAIRVLAIPFVLVFVVAGWHAGTLLSGRTGGRWSAVVAAGVMCSPALAAEQADGELFGAAVVMASLALALTAWQSDSPQRRFRAACAAGALAGAAPLVKQNLLEGLLFLGCLTLVAYRGQDETSRRRAAPVAAGALLGALLVGALVGVWLTSLGTGATGAWRDLVGFRGAAFDAIWSSSPEASIRRGVLLVVLGVVTGLLPVVATWFVSARRGLPQDAAARTAITALLVFGLVAIAAGGSYWPPYLLQLAPAAVLAAGALASLTARAGSWMRGACGLVASVAVLGTLVAAVVHASDPSVGYSQRIGEWLAASKAPGDSAFVAYGLPSVLEAADMPSRYPYLWSVPMRTFDPQQERLRATLAESEAPEWIVQVTGLDAWGIDDGSRLRDLIRDRYRVVGTVCGHRVWLRQDLTRELSAAPSC
jgi:4-amino-4-deoxy-L-arabinose transferase-like glycosyltransferase